MDGTQIAKDLLESILKFLTIIVPIKLPGEIELAVWVWILIIAVTAGILAGIVSWTRR